MAVDNAVAGAGSGLLVAVVVATAWAMLGPRRRRELWVALHSSERRVQHRAIVVLVAMLITIASIFGPGRMRAPEIAPTTWRPLPQLLPEVSFDQRLKDVEVASGFSTTGGVGSSERRSRRTSGRPSSTASCWTRSPRSAAGSTRPPRGRPSR